MKTVQIDILHIEEKTSCIFTVEYWDESHPHENYQTIQLRQSTLLKHIETGYVPCEFYGSDKQYLRENLDEVIKDYITANS